MDLNRNISIRTNKTGELVDKKTGRPLAEARLSARYCAGADAEGRPGVVTYITIKDNCVPHGIPQLENVMCEMSTRSCLNIHMWEDGERFLPILKEMVRKLEAGDYTTSTHLP